MAGDEVVVITAACFSTMFLGLALHRAAVLGPEARKGVSALYAKLVFPTMVFRGVAAIKVESIDPSMVVVILVAKLVVAAACSVFAMPTLRHLHAGTTIAHAAMYAMAATHSFDVTLGVPLAKELFPSYVPYIFLNQSVQLVLVNPLLLVLIELGTSGAGAGLVQRTAAGLATNPLVVMTIAGLVAGQLWPSGMPPILAAATKQVADAGPFLGFLSLGFALAALGGTSGLECRHAATLGAFKLVAMPALYRALGGTLGTTPPLAFLAFLGALPASASVYSQSLVRGLSPKVVGPLVPATMLASVLLALAPLLPGGDAVASAISVAVGTCGAGCGLYSLATDRVASAPTKGGKAS